jgi:hypothetical protein
VEAVTATITLNPSAIAATTNYATMPNYTSYSDITVTWNPAECQGQLAIVAVEPVQGYTPPNEGTLTPPIKGTAWRYDAFDEPQSELCPKDVKVWIAAMWEGQEVPGSRKSILVFPVHEFLIAGLNPNFSSDYIYISLKYGTVLATTGGVFTSVTISPDPQVPCPRFPFDPDPPIGNACTTGSSVVFATTTFSGSENQAASIIGHELLHVAVGWSGGECPAYQWESDHRFQTGIYPCDTGYDANVNDYLFDNMCP